MLKLEMNELQQRAEAFALEETRARDVQLDVYEPASSKLSSIDNNWTCSDFKINPMPKNAMSFCLANNSL